ncbi:hypothetical protein Salmuc_04661 [Salipiger mucosus DSM 16094]|uniref:Uncharacterized protein n=2 Tax=Salipiger mucosus TaxID=263378 RepID=S9RF86_9RHOB|nr:hypothetical protein Salmuc_04661 [Salipiger mucosus DSM 16094]
MLLAALEEGSTLLSPTFYSESGYANRKAAHRLACDRANEAGLTLDPENYDRYGLSPVPGADMEAVRTALEDDLVQRMLDDPEVRREIARDRFGKLDVLERLSVAREVLDDDLQCQLGIAADKTTAFKP